MAADLKVKAYNPALDGLRAVAVTMVFLFHWTEDWNASFPFFRGGFIGVDIFFVLSGFLITRILINDWSAPGGRDVAIFLWKRMLRLLPALSVMVIGVTTIILFSGGSSRVAENLFKDAIFSLLYLENWNLIFSPATSKIFDHCWSLSVEEQYYIVWSLFLCWAIRKMSHNSIIIFLVYTILILTIYRIILKISMGSEFARVYMGTDTRVDTLLYGSLAAFLEKNERLRQAMATAFDAGRFIGSISFGALLLVGQGIDIRSSLYLVYLSPLISLLSLLVILELSFSRSVLFRVLSGQYLGKIGVISYGIYLWHYPVMSFHGLFSGALPQDPARVLVVSALATVALATVSRLVVERPFLMLKSRIMAARA